MVDTVVVNGLFMCHQHSEGSTRSTLPDVCKSPVQPVPYTNVAFAKDLRKGTESVRSHGGASNGVKGSEFYKSIGDELGVGGGIKSGTLKAEATWLSWSPNVFMEGRPVTRHTDKMLMNHGNTISAGGYQVRAAKNSKEQAICNIACLCWVTMRGGSYAGVVLNKMEIQYLRYSACFKASAHEAYPNTALGNQGHPGIVSELGFWDPTNPSNTSEIGKPPGLPTGKEIPWFSGRWFSTRGSRWLDAVWIDSSGKPTDMWDLKFGYDKPNNAIKDKAYRAVAKSYNAEYHSEFRVPEYCNNCDAEENEWEREKIEAFKILIQNALKSPPTFAVPRGSVPVPPIEPIPIFIP